MKRTKRFYAPLLFSFLTAAVILAVCSKSSFLYPMNDWVDVHCFLTMGKSLLNGMIPYVDLYEQKGPVLYFIYAVVSIFSKDSFLGVYLLEIGTFGAFLHFSGKIARLYMGESRMVYLIQIILAVIVCTSDAFCHGGSVEQMCLFIFVYGLYSFLSAVHENRAMTFGEVFVNGLLAACAFWIKYTMMGFYLGLVLFVLIWYLVWLRDVKKLLAAVGQFLLGFGAVTAAVLLFFLAVGGLEEMYNAYFYNNIFLYPDESDLNKWDQIMQKFEVTQQRNPAMPFLLYSGLTFLVLRLHKHYKDLIGVLLCFLGLLIGTYWGKNYAYYGLVLYAFAIFGLTGIGWLLQSPRAREFYTMAEKWIPNLAIWTVTFSMLLSVWYCLENSENVYLMAHKKETMPQYRFARIINQVEDATILNYGFLDGGFYYAADTLPTCKFFCTFNVEAPDMWDTQNACINNKEVDFVITRYYQLNRYSVNASNYELVDTATLNFEGANFTYYLYRLKDSSIN